MKLKLNEDKAFRGQHCAEDIKKKTALHKGLFAHFPFTRKIAAVFSRIDIKPLIMYSALLVWAGVGALFLIFNAEGRENADMPATLDMQQLSPVEILPPNQRPASPALPTSFEELLYINSDTVGYIRIQNTSIEGPVVQTDNNKYYQFNDFHKRPLETGAVYMDYQSRIEDIGGHGNIVLYGCVEDGAFKELLNYKDRTYFEDNRIIEFDTVYSDYKWEVFSVYNTDSSTGCMSTKFASKNNFIDFMRECEIKSIYENEAIPEEDTTVLTLAACGGEDFNPQFVLHARLLK